MFKLEDLVEGLCIIDITCVSDILGRSHMVLRKGVGDTFYLDSVGINVGKSPAVTTEDMLRFLNSGDFKRFAEVK